MTRTNPSEDAPSNGPAAGRRRESFTLAALALPILVAVAIGALVFARPPAPQTPPPVPTSGSSGAPAPRLVYADSPTKGDPSAPVTLVEFLDPECESCRAAHPMVEALLAEYEGDLRLVVRYMPGHTNSALAIAVLEEAGRQGRYWEMLDRLFTDQPEWGERDSAQTDTFLRYAGDLGLDVDAVAEAMTGPAPTKLERDRADGIALGIRGTPSFYVNGVPLEDLSQQGLRTMVEAAIRAAGPGAS